MNYGRIGFVALGLLALAALAVSSGQTKKASGVYTEGQITAARAEYACAYDRADNVYTLAVGELADCQPEIVVVQLSTNDIPNCFLDVMTDPAPDRLWVGKPATHVVAGIMPPAAEGVAQFVLLVAYAATIEPDGTVTCLPRNPLN